MTDAISLLGHRRRDLLAGSPGDADARRPDGQRAGERPGAWRAAHADMPDLREDAAASLVHGGDDPAPARQRVGAVKARDADAVGGRRVVDDGAFRDDEADAVFSASAVVGRDVLVGDVARARSFGSLAPSRCGSAE